MRPFTASLVFVVLALGVFILAAVNFGVAGLNMIAVGLVLYMISHLVP